MEHKIYVEYESFTYGGDIIDPDDRWSSREDTIVRVDFKKLYRQPPTHRFFYDAVDISNPDMLKLDSLYLAVVRYSTGDTFGHTTGAWYIVGVAPTNAIAQLMLDEATVLSKPGDYSSYKPWEGYFERLEHTEIHKLDLE